jgi:pimeloyl-ACP methyl ester carboxylesterase
MYDTLGYSRFAVQGGDWGASAASRLGYAHPDKLIGNHVNLLSVRRDLTQPGDPTPEERRYFDKLAHWQREGKRQDTNGFRRRLR